MTIEPSVKALQWARDAVEALPSRLFDRAHTEEIARNLAPDFADAYRRGIEDAVRWRPWDGSEPPENYGDPMLIAGQYPNGIWYVEQSFWRRDAKRWSGRLSSEVSHYMPLPAPPQKRGQ